MQPVVNIAVRAAREAGNLIMRHLEHVHRLEIATKDHNDFVTEVDRAAEHVIIDAIRRVHPDHAFLGEESGSSGSGDMVWIIDPLDGTTNYLHRFPQFAVSIALQVKGRIDHAVVYDPFKQELFTASRGEGALLDNRKLRVSNCEKLDRALIGTGIPVRAHDRLDRYLAMLRDVVENTSGVRRAGSAALDLAYVAAGRLDGFWEFGLAPWDIAGGMLLVQEAGGHVSDIDESGDVLETGDVLAGNTKIHTALNQLFDASRD